LTLYSDNEMRCDFAEIFTLLGVPHWVMRLKRRSQSEVNSCKIRFHSEATVQNQIPHWDLQFRFRFRTEGNSAESGSAGGKECRIRLHSEGNSAESDPTLRAKCRIRPHY
jgi:hypothetical protein